MPSLLESIHNTPITFSSILQSLPGCRALFNGRYREVIEDVEPTLAILHASKFAQVAAVFAESELRRLKFIEYMHTEHLGGTFIERMLRVHAGHPAEELLKRHASDEQLHGKLFGELAGTTVREHEGSAVHDSESSFHEAYARWVGDDFFALACLLHGFELRSAVLQCYWFMLMDLFPASDAAALRSTFSRISVDEVFHITYTTRLIVEGLSRGESPQILASALQLAEAPIEAFDRKSVVTPPCDR